MLPPPAMQPAPRPSFALSDMTLSTPSSAPVPLPAPSSSSSSAPSSAPTPPPPAGRTTRPSRWSSLEFRLYALAVLAGVGSLAWLGVGLGPGHPSYVRYAHRLRPGWIPNRLVDLSDPQYASFRSNLPSLVGLSLAQLFGRHLLLPFLSRSSSPSGAPSPRALNLYHALSGLAALTVMHGFAVLKLLSLLLGHFWASGRLAGGRWGTLGVWVVGGGLIVGVELSSGFEGWLPAALERHKGLLPRWHVNFNITALRLLSFALDRHWAALAAARETADGGAREADADLPAGQLSPKQRARLARPAAEYDSLAGFLAYAVYAPLYVAGPVVTFNDFAAQIAHPLARPARPRILYALRLLCSLLTMEILLHYVYVGALTRAEAWDGLSGGQLGALGFWSLVVVWLKLLLPWRTFRLWALLDGIDPPENMVRCVANNFSAAGFWRSWHRSYNLWVVRYIYVPLGGSAHPLRATLVVFTFVALWHDLSLRLLVWGWLVTLVVAPELLASRLVPSSKYGDRQWFRHAKALGGSANVLAMCAANLVGFVVGLDGARALWAEGGWGSAAGIRTAVLSLAGVFAAVQLMVEYREDERRHGVWRKY